jgi:murein L,D-transpeptidase YafK
MKRRTFGLLTASAAVTAGCASYDNRFKTYDGPEITSIVLNKGERRMYLMNNETVMRQYDFGLGFAPVGDKQIEGDGKTPEGEYIIDRKNPESSFYLSVGISYPDESDIAEALAMGQDPGGDIFIHGEPNLRRDRRAAKAAGNDWTAGCISVRNREIEEIYAMVQVGTPITLLA